MSQENVIEKSAETHATLNGERKWEIHSRHGLDHRPEVSVTAAVAAYRKRFHVPENEVLKGTVEAWVDGEASGVKTPIAVALASEAEIKAKSQPAPIKSEA